jgi:replicative DNA helicase
MKTLSSVYEEMAGIAKNREFMPTGFHNLDNFLDGGFMRKELVVVGGFTGSGKSFVAGQIFFNVVRSNFKSAYFSLEISNEMVVSRLIGQMANVKPTKIMCGMLNKEENESRIVAKSKLAPWEQVMHFSDEIYRLKDIEESIKTNNYEFLVIDFIQNLITTGKDEYSSMTLAALELQRMAKKYNCCIMVLSQLSNGAAKSGYLEYKGSGGIAMVADLGFFIIRDEENKEKVSLQLKKNRRGISGVIFDLKFKTPGGMICE